MTPHKTNPSFFTPAVVLKTIIFINIMMFIICLIYSGRNITLSLNPFYALTPSNDILKFLGASGRFPIIRYGNWWSLITANWLHGGLLHIFVNMMALRAVGPLIIKEFGISRMFSIYTLAGAFGFLLSYFGNVYLTIGASSGLCGLIGAALYFGKARGGQWGHLVYKEMAISVFMLGLIGFLVPTINNWSHLGGIIGGIILGWVFGYNERRKENAFDKGLAVCFAILTVWLLVTSVVKGFFLIYT